MTLQPAVYLEKIGVGPIGLSPEEMKKISEEALASVNKKGVVQKAVVGAAAAGILATSIHANSIGTPLSEKLGFDTMLKGDIVYNADDYGQQYYDEAGNRLVGTVYTKEVSKLQEVERPVSEKDIVFTQVAGQANDTFNQYESYFVEKGAKATAPEDGKVVSVDGDKVVLKHKTDGLTYFTEIVGVSPKVKKGDTVKANDELGEVTNGVLKFALSKSQDSEYIAPDAILGDFNIDNTAKETFVEAKETTKVVLETLDKEPTATYQPTKAEVEVIKDLAHGDLILEKSEKYDVDPTLVAGLIKQESAFNTKATSHAGAMGLMQLMPATAEWLGVEDAYNPEENVDAGVKYLKRLLNKYENPELALYAYNGGPGNVDKWIAAGTIEDVPFKETREYAPKVLGNTETFKAEADVIAADDAAKQAAEAVKEEKENEQTYTPSLKNEADEKEIAMVEELPYGDIIVEVAEKENVDPVVIAGMIQTESSFNAEAVAPTDGDKGLMQLSKEDIKKYDVEDPFDAEENIQAGVKKFKKLLDKYNNVEKALYAYNGGEETLDKWEEAGLTAEKFPWKETREYADKVLVSFDEYKEQAENTVVSPTDYDELPLPIKAGEFRISSDFDYRTHPVTGEENSFHSGIDLAAEEGTEYYAIAKSKVTHSNASKTAGWIIRTEILEGPLKGYFVDYMHSYKKDVFVKIGDILNPGDLIGLVGNNGQSAGAHLHIGFASGYGEDGKPVYVDLADYSYELQASIGDFTNAKGNKVSKEETKDRIEAAQKEKEEEKKKEKEKEEEKKQESEDKEDKQESSKDDSKDSDKADKEDANNNKDESNSSEQDSDKDSKEESDKEQSEEDSKSDGNADNKEEPSKEESNTDSEDSDKQEESKEEGESSKEETESKDESSSDDSNKEDTTDVESSQETEKEEQVDETPEEDVQEEQNKEVESDKEESNTSGHTTLFGKVLSLLD